MIKIEHAEVFNFAGAIRGMRNPKESWHLSDSVRCNEYDNKPCKKCSHQKDFSKCESVQHLDFVIGNNDMKLAQNLIKAGTDHRKFMRQILVCMDITAPMSWWWDFDTYKVATTKNSCSRMHKLGSRLLTVEDFSFDDESGTVQLTPVRENFLNEINERISKWQGMNKSSDEAKDLWRGIVFDLSAAYNFKATWTGNYEVLLNVYHARKKHKQKEFRAFCEFIETLPYAKELICFEV